MFTTVFSPVWWFRLLRRTRYLHFLIVGVSGVVINLALTAFFAELVFGREEYFSAYLIGLSANLLYNFVLHTVMTFKTTHGHAPRLMAFVAYSLGLAYVQARCVQWLTAHVGVDWYLVVIASVIFCFSLFTFLLFKFVLFRPKPTASTPSTPDPEVFV